MRYLDFIKQFNPLILNKPYIIAEAGVNHEGQMDLAKRLIYEAKEGGADAIKFQTYKAEYLISKYFKSSCGIEIKKNVVEQFKFFQKYDKFLKNEYEKLKIYCDNVNIEFMSTPFDMISAKFLNDLMPVFKISSSDITNRPFIEYISSFSKPIILSTGGSSLHEIEEAISWIKYNNQIALLHCILSYPNKNENANLGMILNLKQKYPNKLIGYSDHTLIEDMRILESAVLLGAVILEKHFTYDKTLKGNDHCHSMDMVDLKCFCNRLNELFDLLGSFEKKPLEVEKTIINNSRRSLVAKRFISKGQIINEDDIIMKRPSYGISPKYFNDVLGKRVNKDLKKDQLIFWSDIF